jgi:hypothetical protein
MWKRRMKYEIDLFRLSEELGHAHHCHWDEVFFSPPLYASSRLSTAFHYFDDITQSRPGL